MKTLIRYVNKYIIENDCKVLGMLQFCVAALALMLGLSIPEKKKQPAFLVACGVFLVAAAGVLAHMIVKLAGYCKADAVVEEEWTEEEWAAEEAMWPADEDLVTGSDNDVTDDDFEKAE